MSRRKLGDNEPFVTKKTVVGICASVLENPAILDEAEQDWLERDPALFRGYVDALRTSQNPKHSRTVILMVYMLWKSQYEKDAGP